MVSRFDPVTNIVRACLVRLADCLCGCSHSRTSFPVTPRAGAGARKTYVACLECGRHLVSDGKRLRAQHE